jgi:shikimate dehydrogenase
MTSATGFAEVIGDPIDHSKSPAIHRFWLDKLKLDGDYRASRVSRAELADFLKQRRSDPAWRGCNVTMPLKLDALMLADGASDLAVTAGAANILVLKDGALLAGNTDIGGVLQLLGPLLKERGADGGITLLGNGGAARAVLVALHMTGMTNVRIQARDLSAAYKLAVEFGLEEQPTTFDQPVRSAGLVNATPLGMAGAPALAIDISAMPDGGWVFDMVTEPADTALLRTARERGLATVDGLAMLVEQAAGSFHLLFGEDAPRQYDAQLMTVLRA